jgi:ATP-dependent Zn protease
MRYHLRMPDERPDRASSTDAERLTAYHEAGHAVMAQLCGRQVTEVEIVGDREHTGMVHSLAFPPDPADDTAPRAEAEDLENQLKIILAGTVTEGMVSGRNGWDETSGDLDVAVRLGMRLVDDCEDVLPLLEDIGAEVKGELQTHWAAVEMLARELLRRKTLNGSDVRKLLAGAFD